MQEKDQHPLLKALIKALRRDWPWLGAAALICGGVAWFTATRETPIYQAAATLQIDPTPPRALGSNVQEVASVGAESFWATKEYYATQEHILRSRRLADATVQRLGLANPWFVQNLREGSPLPADAAKSGLEGAASAEFSSRLRVEREENSRVFSITFDDADPERAARVLAALLDVYAEDSVESAVDSTREAAVWLDDQQAKLRVALDHKETALHEYKGDKDILSVSMDDQANILVDEIRKLNDALTDARTRREGVAARAAALARVSPDDPAKLPARELLESHLLTELRGRYVEADGEVRALRGSGKGSKHPEVESALGRALASRSALLAEVANVQGAVESELRSVDREISGLAALLDDARGRSLELNRLQIEYRRLDRDREGTEKLYLEVLERSEEASLTAMLRFSNARVVDAPMVDKRPISPRPTRSAALGAFLGIVGALGLLVARQLLHDVVRRPEELEELGLTVLGTIPFARGSAGSGLGRRGSRVEHPGRLPFTDSNGRFAEAVRSARTNLRFVSPDRRARVIAVTSALPNDGKSTMASALAASIATQGVRVLLIDADLRKGAQHRIHGLLNDVGLADCVVSRELIADAVRTTDLGDLSVLPAGPHVPNPFELLESDSFRAVLAQALERFDTIVVDTPPLLAVADASHLAAVADGVVLVVRAGRTSAGAAVRAARTLTAVRAKVLGAILNAVVPPRLTGSGYAYSYSYAYGDGRTGGTRGGSRTSRNSETAKTAPGTM